MATFRGLSEKSAILEFALNLLHAMPNHSEIEIDGLFSEAEEGDLFPRDALLALKAEAKEILLKAEFIYPEECEDMRIFSKFRDKVLALGGAY